MEKKAQSMSLNVIIIAIIVLIVAIVLIVIFTTNITKSSQEIASCSLKGGECKSDCGSGEALYQNADCPENQKCCIKVLNTG
ncbi:MAG: hypothetical protein U9R08_05485 [Nanoarchaeota archaeon]|nr:hypothetical protein [Nanoarchaeota archaeon]